MDVDDTLVAEGSFREMLAALDFRATLEPTRNELGMRATPAPELPPANGDGMSSPSSVPLGRTGRKGRERKAAFVQVEEAYTVGA